MDRNKVYEYFNLNKELENTVKLWLNKNHKYLQKKEYSIQDIELLNGGILKVYILEDPDDIPYDSTKFEINIKDLENV